ncbi:UPF0489 family protein [Clostridioides sp. ES-S-0108-01]|uniref:UPF0489 family protein n=1 Tax=unclassified Clostridioides TaxID=2635829 RepID=UPI001D0CD054|nr:UPF0489 family protein [Clostridioides sp. ES-S-0171-01]MCC0689446.1 UPF0489 family protein [Clostridioides sp. ES-S-0056-01]MCC0716662.1 UPF0489 family protein [Clostridioides sp. ES-S-0077-01]MCC0784055.1 UPF0489 family protein [Clostridioides sp. ES-S-0108-01]UDN51113.1 UPF0489 family protein [Clostridioides sp. ES-S-0107-01]UDN54611.1 UPF0489 family protein [Clostridioides sp. ES-S-0054-01]
MENYEYIGFHIKKPVGNNVFSYETREDKSIYVPKLISGTLNDVKLGDEVVFNEIEEGKEIKAKGLENMVEYVLGNKKIYVFDNHNHAFYFWIRSLMKNEFTKGCKLVHVDQHKDTREPDNYNVDINNMRDVFRYTNEVLNVGSFIKPALRYNVFSELIIIDSSYGFDLDIESEFVLDIDLDIFSSDMDYIPFDFKLEKIQNLIKKAKVITIATSPYFINQEYAIKVLKELFNYDII